MVDVHRRITSVDSSHISYVVWKMEIEKKYKLLYVAVKKKGGGWAGRYDSNILVCDKG